MPTVGEEIERRREKKEEEERIKEQELAYQAQLAEALALEQRRQEEAKRGRSRQLAKQVAKREIKKRIAAQVGKKAAVAAGRAAVSAIGSALAAAAPYIGIALLIIAIIAGVILLTVVVVAYLCNAGGITGGLVQGGSAVLGVLGFPGGSWCEQLSGIGGAITAPAVGGDACPRVPKPPSVTTIQCADCLDIKVSGPEVPVSPASNSLANRGAVLKLKLIAALNRDFRLTEAFCPTVYHADHDHYNGYAVDIDVLPGLEGDKAKLAKLYNDARGAGFTSILCEYPSGYLSAYGINCSGTATTRGAHFHIEEPHAD